MQQRDKQFQPVDILEMYTAGLYSAGIASAGEQVKE